LRALLSGKAPAFQAGNTGSIPVARSILRSASACGVLELRMASHTIHCQFPPQTDISLSLSCNSLSNLSKSLSKRAVLNGLRIRERFREG
jgi:hypothetical protein